MKAKDTFFCRPFSFNCRGKLHEFNEPVVMGIVNLTPDSFYSGSRARGEREILQHCERHISEGATILDIGGCSTRPGSVQVSEDEEKERVFPVFTMIRKEFPEVLISIDTYRSSIAEQAAKEGADIINDVSGWSLDEKMLETAGKTRLPYVLTHIKGDPETMQKNPVYTDVLAEVLQYFSKKISLLKQAGVKDIILDPGFGFGKTINDNYRLLNNLNYFSETGFPILAGISRKGMIQKAAQCNAEEAGNGTTVANTVALLRGASIVRVHDTKQTMEAIRILRYLN